jgi:hypothetical protein
MAGIGVQGHVGDHAQRREALLERADGALGQALVVPGADRIQRLGLGAR